MRYYEWDPAKAAANRAKHGVSFETAVKVFDDPNALTILDRIEGGEERWQTIGEVDGRTIFMIAHTMDDDGEDEIVRIISARGANRQERATYEAALRESHGS